MSHITSLHYLVIVLVAIQRLVYDFLCASHVALDLSNAVSYPHYLTVFTLDLGHLRYCYSLSGTFAKETFAFLHAL